MIEWEHGIALQAMQGYQSQLPARGKSHGFSRVAAGMILPSSCVFSNLRTPV